MDYRMMGHGQRRRMGAPMSVLGGAYPDAPTQVDNGMESPYSGTPNAGLGNGGPMYPGQPVARAMGLGNDDPYGDDPTGMRAGSTPSSPSPMLPSSSIKLVM